MDRLIANYAGNLADSVIANTEDNIDILVICENFEHLVKIFKAVGEKCRDSIIDYRPNRHLALPNGASITFMVDDAERLKGLRFDKVATFGFISNKTNDYIPSILNKKENRSE
jgi:hypothetical protein